MLAAARERSPRSSPPRRSGSGRTVLTLKQRALAKLTGAH